MDKIKFSHTDEMESKGKSFIIYGDPGVGKTTLIKTLPPEECFLISVDAGEYVLRDIHCPIFPLGEEKGLDDFRDLIAYLHSHETLFKYIFIDNMTELEKFFLIGITNQAGKKVPKIGEWGDSAFYMRKYIRDLRALTYKGMNVIYIFWAMRLKITDDNEQVHSQIVPMVMEKTTMEYCGLVDFVGYMGIDPKKGERYIQFVADKLIHAKKRDLGRAVLDEFERPDLGAIFKKLEGGKDEKKIR